MQQRRRLTAKSEPLSTPAEMFYSQTLQTKLFRQGLRATLGAQNDVSAEADFCRGNALSIAKNILEKGT